MKARTLVAPIPALLLLISAVNVSAQVPVPVNRATVIQALDSIAALSVQAGRVAGLSVAVVHGSDTLLLRAYGRVDVATDEPVGTATAFEIASITKTFTAAAVLRLAQEGKLDLDDELNRWLPDYPTHGHRVTIRRLLDHTAGIPGFSFQVPMYQRIFLRSLPRDSMMQAFSAEPFDFAPGTAMTYSNSGYFLLGKVIEQASGIPYEEYVRLHFFEPLGMTRSGDCADEESSHYRARGHMARAPGELGPSPTYDQRLLYAAGGLCSTAGDLVRWLQGLHGGVILDSASYAAMITPDTLPHGHVIRYAKGMHVTHDPAGHRVLRHGGAVPGFAAESRYYPDGDLHIVVLMNTYGSVDPEVIANALARTVLGPGPQVAVAPLPADVDGLVGRYSGAGRNARMTVSIERGTDGLMVRIGDAARPTPIRHLGDDTFAVITGTGHMGAVRFMFVRGAAGGPPALHFDQDNAHYILTRQR